MTTNTSLAPVGRSNEYRMLANLIAPQRPALLIIAGPPGSGRTNLVIHLRDAAARQGFHSIGVDEQLVVEPVTGIADVLRVLVALSGNEPITRKSADPRSSDNFWGKVSEWWDNVMDNAHAEKEVFDKLATSSPLFLTIDGYHPSEGFGTWVRHRLVTWLRKTSSPVVLVIVGTVSEVNSLRDISDGFVILGDLEITEVRAHLANSAADMRPKITAAELDTYSESAAKQPGLVGAFDRVFAALIREGVDGTP